jgi:transcriptional regulator with XRE-family HTH domain
MKPTYDTNAMRERLTGLLEQHELSMRDASIRGGTTPGYLYSIIKTGAEPTVQKLAKICEANNFSLTYVLFGFEISPETERLMSLMENDPQARDGILSLLDKK